MASAQKFKLKHYGALPSAATEIWNRIPLVPIEARSNPRFRGVNFSETRDFACQTHQVGIAKNQTSMADPCAMMDAAKVKL